MSKEIKVIVNNSVELSDLLEKLEAQGYKWGSGDLPTELIPFDDFPYVIRCTEEKSIYWATASWKPTIVEDAISVKDYLALKDDEEKTVSIKRHDIHSAMADVIKEDDEIGKLFDKQPLLFLAAVIIIETIERKIFEEKGEE